MNILKLIISIAVPLTVGFLGSYAGMPSEWYADLAKPALNPPNWIFGPAWTTLYLLMGIAAFLVWRCGWYQRRVRVALAVFLVQLVINGAWSFVFFTLEVPGWAFAHLLVLLAAVIATMIMFARISRTAAWLLVPYLAWVMFAGYLNAGIWLLN